MAEDALISPISEYVDVFNRIMHPLCSSSDWTGTIRICPCLLDLPQSLPRFESDCFYRVTHLLSTELVTLLWLHTSELLCLCVVFLL